MDKFNIKSKLKEEIKHITQYEYQANALAH